jgi:DNA recombination-dependent growth factor C
MFAVESERTLPPSLSKQFIHAASEKVEASQVEMLETVEFGELRNELGDTLLLYVC